MVAIPKHIQDLAPYKAGKPAANMFGNDGAGRQVVLSSNENNFGPAPGAMKALAEATSQMYLYPDPTASVLKEKLSHHLSIAPENISVSNGSDAILYTMFKAFLSPGEHILTSHGAFVSARIMARMNNILCVEVPMSEGFHFDLQRMLESITPTTKLIYLVNPNNPTGTLIPQKSLHEFLAQVPAHILVVIDEAYFEFATYLTSDYPDGSRMGFDNVIVLRTFSKAYGMAGLRLGYAIGPEYLIAALNKVKLTFDPNLAAQIAGTAALDDKEFLQLTLKNNAAQLDLLYTAYEELNLQFIRSYANFIMLDLGTEERVETMYSALLDMGVLTRRLNSFGLPHCLRVSVGRPEDNSYYLEKLKIALTHREFNGMV